MPLLVILVMPKPDGTLSTKVYRRPSHTDPYRQWDSHHTISAKYIVISTLFHRSKALCSNQQLLHQEQTCLQEVFHKCKYPTWALNRIKLMNSHQPIYGNSNSDSNNSDNQNNTTSGFNKKDIYNNPICPRPE